MKKLESLTPSQTELIACVRNEWIQFCLGGDSTINRKVATEGIRWIYGLAKLKSPFVIFVDGPMACQYAVWFLKAWLNKMPKQTWAQVWAQVGDQVWAQVWAQVVAQVGDQVVDQVVDQVWAQVVDHVEAQVVAQVGDQVRDQVWDQVGDQVGAQVGAQVEAQVGAQVGDQVWAQVGGSYNNYAWRDLANDSGWASYIDFFDRIGIKVMSEYKRYQDYIKSGVFMTIFLNGFAIVCPRPSIVKRDERNRLHGQDCAAIEWKNEKYFFWHGTRVTEKIICRPQEITLEEIMNEKNSEVSRAIAERLGWDEYMKRVDTVLIDKWFDTRTSCHYELYDFKKRFELTPKLLKMESPELNDGTRPYYIEPVHPELKTCEAARRWQFQKADGTWPEPTECNQNSELSFEVEA